MEVEHPGILAAMWEAARPIIAQSLEDTLPDLWDGLAAVYAKHSTPAQLDECIRFFESPTGRKFVAEMNRNVDIKPMMGDSVTSSDGRIGEMSYRQTVSGAAMATVSAMSPPRSPIRAFSSPRRPARPSSASVPTSPGSS